MSTVTSPPHQYLRILIFFPILREMHLPPQTFFLQKYYLKYSKQENSLPFNILADFHFCFCITFNEILMNEKKFLQHFQTVKKFILLFGDEIMKI